MPRQKRSEPVESDDSAAFDQAFEMYRQIIRNSAVALIDAADMLQLCFGHLPAERSGNAELSLREMADQALGRISNAAFMASRFDHGPTPGPLDLTIKKEPFERILDGTKTIEYREVKEHYLKKLGAYFDFALGELGPFQMRLRNGYGAGMPAITVEVAKVTCNNGMFELHLGNIVEHKNLKPEQKQMLTQRRAARE